MRLFKQLLRYDEQILISLPYTFILAETEQKFYLCIIRYIKAAITTTLTKKVTHKRIKRQKALRLISLTILGVSSVGMFIGRSGSAIILRSTRIRCNNLPRTPATTRPIIKDSRSSDQGELSAIDTIVLSSK